MQSPATIPEIAVVVIITFVASLPTYINQSVQNNGCYSVHTLRCGAAATDACRQVISYGRYHGFIVEWPAVWPVI